MTDTAGGGRGGRGRPPVRLGPTKAELTQWLDANKDKVRGKIVLLGKAAEIPVDFNPPAKRRRDDEVRAQFDPANPNAGRGFGRGPAPEPDPNRLTAAQVAELEDAWLKENGAVVRVNDAAMQHGLIRGFQQPHLRSRQGHSHSRDAQ